MKRTLSVLLLLCMMLSLLSGCGSKKETPPAAASSPAASAAVSAEPEVPAEPKILLLPSNAAASSANPWQGTQDSDSEIHNLISVSLYGRIPREDRQGAMLVPMLAAAEPVDVSGDGTVWQIAINPDAKWENGEAMNADTFLYSFKMALDPKLLFNKAGALANTYVEIKNATAYYSQVSAGTPVDWEEVGVKKVDDMTLEITLASSFSKDEVMRHFAQQCAAPVYEPLFESCLNADRTESTYGADAESICSCGPFSMTEWVRGSVRRFVRNDNYIRSDLINLDEIVYHVVTDKSTQLQMFEAGELDNVLLDANGLEKYGEDPRLASGASSYIRMIDICDTNPSKPILANENFKKALFYSIDRETIAKLARKMPATWVVPGTSVAYSDGTSFRSLDIAQSYLPDNYGYDPALALEYFNKAMEEEGLKSLELSILYSSSSADHKIIAEYLQEAWPQIFGSDRFQLTLNAMPSAQALEQKKSCVTVKDAYELTISDWALSAGNYNPAKHMQQYVSTYGKRNAPYHSTKLDELYAQTLIPENRMDQKKLAALAAEMEKTIIEECVTIPVLENRTFNMFSDRLILPLDDKDTDLGWGFRFADIAQ